MAAPFVVPTLAALVALVGVALVALRPGRRDVQLLAAGLLLRGGVMGAYALLQAAPDAATALAYAHLVAWYSIPVPLLTGALALAWARPARGVRIGATALLGVLTAGALVAMALDPTLFVRSAQPLGDRWAYESGILTYGLAGAAALLDGVLVLAAARAARREDATAASARAAALVGLAFALTPLHSAAFLATYLPASGFPLDMLLLRVSLTLAGGVLALAGLARLAPRATPRGRLLGATVGALLLVVGVLDALHLLRPGFAALLPGYDTSLALLRLAFALVIGHAMLRYGFADAGRQERARLVLAARVLLVAVAGAILAALAVALLGANVAGYSLALVGVALAPAAGWRATQRPAARLVGALVLWPTDARAAQERARAYAQAFEAARRADGTLEPEGERLLATLREDLGISEREHELLRLAGAPRAADASALLGRYRPERELGRGATSVVWQARESASGDAVVVKRFTAARAAADVLREARALAQVQHPRVLRLREIGREGADIVLVLDLAEGGSARALLDREGALPPERAVALVLDLLEGLEALHGAGLVHGDVKPENLLLDADGRGLLGDFGSARFLDADETMTGAAAQATLATAAPEVLAGRPPDARADVFSAGALLYRLLTAEHHVDLRDVGAYEARERVLLDPPRLPHPRVPPDVEALLRRALAKRPEARYPDAASMRAALASLTRPGTPGASGRSR